MAKIKASKKDSSTKQEHLNDVKNGYVNKKKFPKYKNTPSGKVPVISDTKQQNKKKNNNITLVESANKREKLLNQKTAAKNNQNVSPQKKQTNGNVSSYDEGMNNNKNNSKYKLSKQGKLSKAVVKGKKNVDRKSIEKDELNLNTSDEVENRLSDESDEEDIDFDRKSNNKDGKGSVTENKGVKMFTGVQPEMKKKLCNNEKDSDDSNSDSENENNESNESMSASLSSENKEHQISNTSNEGSTLTSEMSDDDDDDDDDGDNDLEEEDDEESEEDEANKSELGLKALLGNTLVDDDDDEDFDEKSEDDEDEDISDDEEEEDNTAESDTDIIEGKRRRKVQAASTNSETDEYKLTPGQTLEKDKRTIFIGNVPKHTKKEQLKKVFSKYGPIESIRLRGIVPEKMSIPLKVAAIKKQFHPQLQNIIAYITYKSEESVENALCMNGKLFKEHYLTVDTVIKSTETKIDPKKAVFLGNLPYNIDNNSVWKHFSDCGGIESVRVVRHRKFGACIGIGYVNFKTENAAQLALELNGTMLKNKEIRVQPYSSAKQVEKKNKNKSKKRSHPNEDNQFNEVKKHKKDMDRLARATHNSKNAERRKEKKLKKSQSEQTHGEKVNTPSPHKGTGTFQGQKGDMKLKHKRQKLDKKKKILAEKLTATSKKPVKK